jgi:hypothetical protein
LRTAEKLFNLNFIPCCCFCQLIINVDASAGLSRYFSGIPLAILAIIESKKAFQKEVLLHQRPRPKGGLFNWYSVGEIR